MAYYNSLFSEEFKDRIRLIDENMKLLEGLFALRRKVIALRKDNFTKEALLGINRANTTQAQSNNLLYKATMTKSQIRKLYEKEFDNLEVKMETMLEERERLKRLCNKEKVTELPKRKEVYIKKRKLTDAPPLHGSPSYLGIPSTRLSIDRLRTPSQYAKLTSTPRNKIFPQTLFRATYSSIDDHFNTASISVIGGPVLERK